MIPQATVFELAIEATLASDLGVQQTESDELKLRSLLVVLGLVIFADVALYSNHGYAGVALLLLVAPCLMVAGAT